MYNYTLQDLALNFMDHAKEFEKIREESIKKYREQYQDDELPLHLKNEFNLSLALSVMCDEIEKLKKSVNIKK